MSTRDSGWKMIVESEKVQDWLRDDTSIVLQITTDDFSAVGCQPVRLIPTYSATELPKELKRRSIELLRNQAGGCLLIKIGEAGLPTLYPEIKEPIEHYTGKPFHPIPKLSVLANKESLLINEETGIHLAWAMGVFQSFLMDCFSPYDIFSFGGRLKTSVKGEFVIEKLIYPVDALVEVDGYFESDHRIVVLETKKSQPETSRSDFSIHQLILPLILVRPQSEKICTGLLLDWSIDGSKEYTSICFRLYHYDIPGVGSSINPFGYSLTKSKVYTIQV
jgi:hypothetical protein